MRHHHETIVELRPDRTKFMFLQPRQVIIHTNSISTFVTTHPIHITCQDHAKLINSAHTIKDYMHIHILHALNRVFQLNPTTNNQKHGKEHKSLHQSRLS